MKQKFNKISSIFLTLMILLGVLAPAASNIAEATDTDPEVQVQTKVVIHKILMKDKEAMGNHNVAKEGYDGNKIGNITQFFGDGSSEIPEVAFDVYKLTDNEVDGSVQLSTNEKLFGNYAKNDYKDKYAKKVNTDKLMTGADGVNITLGNGTYIIVEDKAASTYVGPEKELLAASRAVPSVFTLPFTKTDGTGFLDELHLYPKNTQEKPTIEKTVKKADVRVGEEIEYTIKSVIKAGSEYQALRWSDIMVHGLDFKVGSIAVKYNRNKVDTEMTVTPVETSRGFTINLTNDQLEEVQSKDHETTIEITYKAILNSSAKITTPIPNTVVFEYGNNPSEYSEPTVGHPKNGKITIEKTWSGAVSKEVKFDIFEKETGVLVETVTLVKDATSVSSTVPLDDHKEYFVIERDSNLTDGDGFYLLTGMVAKYSPFNDQGTVSIENKKTPNITEETKVDVQTHGKKFIKVDKDNTTTTKGLKGAKFVVTKDDQYLALKDAAKKATEKTTYDAAEAAYQANPSETTKTERDNAYKALKIQWEFVAEKANAFVFTSDDNGRVEVSGLETGDYILEEIQAPATYALPTNPKFEFRVDQNSWEETGDITAKVQKVLNTKVSIPQTGGIGSVIFVVVGLAIMGGAAVAMKKRNVEEA